MVRTLLGIGSNLGERLQNVGMAVTGLQREGLRICRLSSIYESQPVGYSGQSDFLNCVCEVETSLTPERLLQVCQKTEADLGRVRTTRWAARSMDIDILYFGQWIIRTPELAVPHPRIHLRKFVLLPLCEIDPWFVDPLQGVTIRTLLEECPAFYWVRPAGLQSPVDPTRSPPR